MRIILFIILLFCTTLSFGQRDYIPSIELTEADGLPATRVRGGMQCSRGFIWFFGHNGGLCRYDAFGIKRYSQGEHGLASDFLTSVVEAPDSLLWIRGKTTGEREQDVCVFNPTTEQSLSLDTFFEGRLPFPSREMHRIKNQDGSFWLMHTGSDPRIFEYDGKTLKLWGTHLSQEHPETTFKVDDSLYVKVYPTKDKTGTEISFVHHSGKLLEHQRLVQKEFEAVYWASKKNEVPMLVLSCYDKTKGQQELIKIKQQTVPQLWDSLALSPMNCYLSNGEYFLRVTAREIKVIDVRTGEHLRIPPMVHDLIPRTIVPIFDNQGGIWLANQRALLNRWQKPGNWFQTYPCFELGGGCFLASRGISEGLDGDVLVAHTNTLLQVTSEGKSIFHKKEQGTYDLTGIFLQEEKEALWLIDGDSVLKLNPHHLDSNRIAYPYENNVRPGGIKQVYVDQENTLWVGSAYGLSCMVAGDSILRKYKQYNGFDLLKEAYVSAFYEKGDQIWLSTAKGIFLLDKKKGILDRFSTQGKGKNYLPHDLYSHLLEDKDGRFWLASKGAGVIHWNPKTGDWTQYTTKDGLSDNVLYAVYEDDYEKLWLPSNYGLMSFDKQTKEVLLYLEEDGIPNLEFNSLSHFKGKNGRLYFGGLNGAMSFDPSTFATQTVDREWIHITGFKKQNWDDEVKEGLIELLKTNSFLLYPEDKNFELSFAFLAFKKISENRYAYKIEGYDNNWQTLEKPLLKINGLPYGNYQIRLRAKAPGVPWEEIKQPIQVLVLRPFYLQGWFLILSALVLLLGLGAFFRWRLANLEKQKEALEELVQQRTTKIADQAKKLKVLDKVKSQFFANVSHELRTPLTLILGPLSKFREKPFEALNKNDFQRDVQLMERNGKQLLTLVEEILELSKLEAEKVELKTKHLEFRDFIYRVFSAFDSLSKINGINYKLTYQVREDLVLLLDPSKVEKVLNNFLSNAFKFINKEGSIELIVEEKEQTMLVLVKDSGQGISSEDLPFVFDRFYQSKSPREEAYGGTGIGLAMSKELAVLMGGNVWVESRLEEGSTFYFEFPKIKRLVEEVDVLETIVTLQPMAPSENEEEVAWNPTAKSQTLLVVEDNIDMSNFIYQILIQNYNIIRAQNGQEGLECLKERGKEIDLIVSDVMMPFMDGFTMLEQIKSNDYWRSIPVILLTARAGEEDKLRGLTIGVDDYLTKPFSTRELEVRIQNLLQNYAARKLWKQDLLLAAKEIHSKEMNLSKTENNKEKIKEVEALSSISKTDLKWMKELECFIKDQLSEEDFDVEKLAQKVFLSKRQMDRKIKKITGLSSGKLIKEVRLQMAREYLEKGTFKTVMEVGYAIGIQTTSYFVQLYVKRFGKKPKDYF